MSVFVLFALNSVQLGIGWEWKHQGICNNQQSDIKSHWLVLTAVKNIKGKKKLKIDLIRIAIFFTLTISALVFIGSLPKELELFDTKNFRF